MFFFLGISFIFLSYIFFKNKYLAVAEGDRGVPEEKEVIIKPTTPVPCAGRNSRLQQILRNIGLSVYDTNHPCVIIHNFYYYERTPDEENENENHSEKSSESTDENTESEDLMVQEAKEFSTRDNETTTTEEEEEDEVIPF